MHVQQVGQLKKLLRFSSRTHSPLHRCIKTLGIGIAPFLCCSTDSLVLSTAVEIPAKCPLVVIPEKSVWTVSSVHDDDMEGLMPTLEACRSAFPPSHEDSLFDVFYLALYFSINACRSSSGWSEWQLQQISPRTVVREEDDVAAFFLRSLSQYGLTPPMQLFLSMRDYTLSHSCRLSQNGTIHQPEGGPILAVMPLVDIALNKDHVKGNLSLERYDARHVRTLIQAYPLLYLRHGLRMQPDTAGYWVLQTVASVFKGECLTLWQKI